MSDLISRSEEEWKDIQGYEGLYQVSNLGNIKNKKGKLLKPFRKGKYGHSLVGLSKDNKSTKYQVHRIVAIHFIPNPENKPEVCHKDNTLDKNGFLDNSASNLIWGTHKENCEFENTRKRQSENHADFTGENNPNYGNKYSDKNKEKLMKERGKQVLQWKDGRVIAFYESLRDAERKTGICWVNIRNVCDRQYKHAGGYEWSYVCKPYDVEKVVAELEKLPNREADYYYANSNDVIDREDAIEIVKQGGVSDDVCEWKLEDEEANLYLTGCQQRQLIFDGTPKENGYRYCPYCGKKIKVVE